MLHILSVWPNIHVVSRMLSTFVLCHGNKVQSEASFVAIGSGVLLPGVAEKHAFPILTYLEHWLIQHVGLTPNLR